VKQEEEEQRRARREWVKPRGSEGRKETGGRRKQREVEVRSYWGYRLRPATSSH